MDRMPGIIERRSKFMENKTDFVAQHGVAEYTRTKEEMEQDLDRAGGENIKRMFEKIREQPK